MAESRFIVIPPTPKNMPLNLTFVDWFIWYCEAEPKLKESLKLVNATQRLVSAIEDLKPPTEEIKGEADKPIIEAYEGDIGEWRNDDWKLIIGFLTGDKAPACGWGPTIYGLQPDGKRLELPFPARRVLGYIEAIESAATKHPRPAPQLPPPEPPSSPEPPAAAAPNGKGEGAPELPPAPAEERVA